MNDLIYGTRKQGKSTLALALAVARNNRVVVFDPNDQYPLIRHVSIDQIHTEESVTDKKGFFLLAVGPFDSDELESRFDEFATTMSDVRNVSIIVDEAHLLQGGNWIDPSLDRWNRRTPSTVCLIQTTHRIVDAHPDSRYHADNVFFFYAYLPREIKTIRDSFGPEVAEAIPLLKRHEVIRFTKQSGGIPKWEKWDIPQEWYIDLRNEND